MERLEKMESSKIFLDAFIIIIIYISRNHIMHYVKRKQKNYGGNDEELSIMDKFQ